MILVDANILLYAEDSLSQHHVQARTWWDEQLSGSAPVCLCWPVVTAFIRIGTNARLHRRPLTIKEASDRVQSWLDQPCVRMIQPTDQHWLILHRNDELAKETLDAVMASRTIDPCAECPSCSVTCRRGLDIRAQIKWSREILS